MHSIQIRSSGRVHVGPRVYKGFNIIAPPAWAPQNSLTMINILHVLTPTTLVYKGTWGRKSTMIPLLDLRNFLLQLTDGPTQRVETSSKSNIKQNNKTKQNKKERNETRK